MSDRTAHAGRLSSRVKGLDLAPRDISVVWVKRGRIIYAINGITKEELDLASRYTIPDLVNAAKLTVREEGGIRWLLPEEE